MDPKQLQGFIDQRAKIAAQQVFKENASDNTFGVSDIPAHTHNGTDSQPVDFSSITNRALILPVTIPGIQAQTASNYSIFFIAPYPMVVQQIQEVHSTAGSINPTLNIEKLTGAQASGSGINILSTAFDLTTTANSKMTGTLASAISTKNLAIGDRLGLVIAGTLTSLVNVNVTLVLFY